MPNFGNYDAGRVNIIVLGQLIQGLADGTMVKVSRKTPSFSTKVGGTGDVVRSKSRDRRGVMTFTLLDSSPSNDYLSALVLADEAADGGPGQVGVSEVRDLQGTSFAHGANSWVVQPADQEYAPESGTREWMVEFAQLEIFTGGRTV